MADTKTQRKPKQEKPEAPRQQTEYVILERLDPRGVDGTGAALDVSALAAEGKVWIETPGALRGARGDEAIKAGTKTGDGHNRAGTFKAVPTSTWLAENNNLGIKARQEVVNQFDRGALNGAPKVEEPPGE